MKFSTIYLWLLVLAPAIMAQQIWSLNGQIRHRYEYDHKVFDADLESRQFHALRSRLGVTVLPTGDTELFLQFQDSRIFGEEPSTMSGQAPNFDLHQGYFMLANLLDTPLSFKAGRMEVAYGTQRLLGSVGWSNIGRSFDGLMLQYAIPCLQVDVFNLKENETMQRDDLDDRNVFGFYSMLKLSDAFQPDIFFIWQRQQPKKQLDRYTTGAQVQGALGGWFYTAELALQSGTYQSQDVQASLLALNTGYSFEDSRYQPTFSIGLESLSGDDDKTDDTYRVFDTLYATNHKFYGFMDFFINIPNSTRGLGLQDLLVRGAIKPAPLWSASITFHDFQTAVDPTDTIVDSRGLGRELDVTVKFEYNKATSLALGYSLFIPGDQFSDWYGSQNAQWFYAMTTVTF